jgi:hypothetical protein
MRSRDSRTRRAGRRWLKSERSLRSFFRSRPQSPMSVSFSFSLFSFSVLDLASVLRVARGCVSVYQVLFRCTMYAVPSSRRPVVSSSRLLVVSWPRSVQRSTKAV